MLKVTRKFLTWYIVITIILFIILLTREFYEMQATIAQFEDLVRRANRYATLQTQDIDIVKKQIIGSNADPRSVTAYRQWLNSMSGYRGFSGMTVNKNGSYFGPTSSTGEGSSDEILTDSIIPFLINDLNDSDSKGYTPLNFGMTYLDPILLRKDMLEYLQLSIRKLSPGTSFGTWGNYRIDPSTIEVEVEMDMTPFNIEDLLASGNPDSQRAFIQMFGLDVNDSDTARLIGVDPSKRNRIKTVVRYDITYRIKWDYIPYSPLTRVPSSVYKSGRYNEGNIPQHIYYPWLYTEDGELNPNPSVRFKDGRYKMLLPGPVEYKFSYVLTH